MVTVFIATLFYGTIYRLDYYIIWQLQRSLKYIRWNKLLIENITILKLENEKNKRLQLARWR